MFCVRLFDECLFVCPLVFQSVWKMPLDKLLMVIPTPQTESQRKRLERMSITMRWALADLQVRAVAFHLLAITPAQSLLQCCRWAQFALRCLVCGQLCFKYNILECEACVRWDLCSMVFAEHVTASSANTLMLSNATCLLLMSTPNPVCTRCVAACAPASVLVYSMYSPTVHDNLVP
jgi:hypothetical protein